LENAYNREKSALRKRGIPSSAIRMERSPKLVDHRLNPGGFAITNRVDERFGLGQGINRSMAMGIDPKAHGMSEGFVPNFRFGMGFLKGLRPGSQPTRNINPNYRPSRKLPGGRTIPASRGKKYSESKNKFAKRRDKWEKQKAKTDASMSQMTMAAMFMGPMISQQIDAGQTAKGRGSLGGAVKNMGSSALMGAGFGAMLGTPGMAFGALGGAAYGAADSAMNWKDNKALSDIGEDLSKGKDKLDEKLKDLQAMIKYREGVQGLNDAFKSGDITKIKEGQKLMSESIASIVDPSVIDKLNSITNGTMSFSDQIEALSGVLKDAENNAKNAKNALEIGTAVSAGIEREKSVMSSAGEMLVDYGLFLPSAGLSSAVSQWRSGAGVTEGMDPTSWFGAGGMTAKLDSARWDESESKDFASKLKANFKQANTKSVAEITQEEFDRKKVLAARTGGSFDQTFDEFSKDFQDQAAVESARETLTSMQKDFGNLEEARLDILRGSIRGNRFGKGVDQNKLLYGDKDDLENASIMKGHLSDLEEKNAKDKLNNSSFIKALRDGGQSAAADKIVEGIIDPSENNLSKENLLMMKEQIQTQEKLIESLDSNADSNSKNATKVKNIEDELKSLIKEVRLLNFAIEDFNKNRETVERVRSINRDTIERDFSGKNNILSSVGAITEREKVSRSNTLQNIIARDSNNQELRSSMMERLLKGADPNSLIDMNQILKDKGLSAEKDEGTFLEREKKENEKKERPEREEFTNKFTDFMKQNADGNVTLVEIKGFLETLNSSNEYSNRIQTDMRNIELRNGAVFSAQLNQLKSENRNKMLELDAKFINKMGSSILGTNDTTKLNDAIRTGGLNRKGERSKFVKGLGRTVSEKENEAINSQSQAFLEESLGINLSGLTGRTGLDQRKAKINRNIEKMDKDIGPDGDPLIDFLEKRKKVAFANIDSVDQMQKSQFNNIGYGGELSDSLSDNGKMLASTLSIADNTESLFKLASNSGINISTTSQSGIATGIANSISSMLGDSVKQDLGEKTDSAGDRAASAAEAKKKRETPTVFAPVKVSGVRGKSGQTGFQEVRDPYWKRNRKQVTKWHLGDPKAGPISQFAGSDDPLNKAGTDLEKLPAQTKNLHFLAALSEEAKDANGDILTNDLVSNLARKLELLKSKPNWRTQNLADKGEDPRWLSTLTPKNDTIKLATKIIREQQNRVASLPHFTKLKNKGNAPSAGLWPIEATKFENMGIGDMPPVLGTDSPHLAPGYGQRQASQQDNFGILKDNIEALLKSYDNIENVQIDSILQDKMVRKAGDNDGVTQMLKPEQRDFLKQADVDVSGYGQLNIPQWAKDEKGFVLEIEKMKESWKAWFDKGTQAINQPSVTAPTMPTFSPVSNSGSRRATSWGGSLRSPVQGGPFIHDTQENVMPPSPYIASTPGADHTIHEVGKDGKVNQIDQAATEGVNKVSESINELPKAMKNELESVIFNHGITGNVTLDFNTEMFSQALGPVMFDQLKNMLLDPIISEVMARALEGRLNIRPDQIN
jgi:hypothetical protein